MTARETITFSLNGRDVTGRPAHALVRDGLATQEQAAELLLQAEEMIAVKLTAGQHALLRERLLLERQALLRALDDARRNVAQFVQNARHASAVFSVPSGSF